VVEPIEHVKSPEAHKTANNGQLPQAAGAAVAGLGRQAPYKELGPLNDKYSRRLTKPIYTAGTRNATLS
jgi:hypothetical protein